MPKQNVNQTDAPNKRVVGLISQWFCPEPFGSGFGLFVFVGILLIPPHTPNFLSKVNQNKYFN